MNEKYEFTGETKVVPTLDPLWDRNVTLHRIRALKDLDGVYAGNKGGWIESENNLSFYDNAWVYDEAQVYDDAKVCDNSKVCNRACVFGQAFVGDNAVVKDDAEVSDKAQILGNAKICGNAKVFRSARIYDEAVIGGNAVIEGDFTAVHGNIYIGGEAELLRSDHYLLLEPINWLFSSILFYRNKQGRISVMYGENCDKIYDSDEFINLLDIYRRDHPLTKACKYILEYLKTQADLDDRDIDLYEFDGHDDDPFDF